jgi:glucokinase
MKPVRGPANDHLMQARDDPKNFPRLLADIGGTNVRFALEQEDGRINATFVRPLKAFPSISHAISTYLSQPQAVAAGAIQVRYAAFALAGPIAGDFVRMTNADWSFSTEVISREFNFEKLLVMNDFTALSMAIPRLTHEQIRQIGGGSQKPKNTIGLIGAGTGLGVSGLIPSGDTWLPLATEGGHVSFSPMNDRELDILRFVWREFSHVSAERLLSGMGLELLYRALISLSDATPDAIDAPEIARRALANECPICEETIETFCVMLGTVASNLALTLGAQGGIYIGGGIVQRLGLRFDQSGFRKRFEEKGRYASYLSAIPTYVITAENPAFLGLSAMLGK